MEPDVGRHDRVRRIRLGAVQDFVVCQRARLDDRPRLHDSGSQARVELVCGAHGLDGHDSAAVRDSLGGQAGIETGEVGVVAEVAQECDTLRL